ncbi:GEM-like protein 4 [Brachypodium distachyon]|uniref:GRAM domain-containing protein n=1 Tax=Brachypodium distachyon TaxID=15368 RepID=I1IBX0_BRADI|nr:GEM-like protein 4 [Brachypodium distachyon]KQK00479.1 hypothetical protein BRADI_3g49710v3 [Brachypodium distachyon]|eukprot:XP_003569948.1 GEM-like protein 4 [Brachypodium distachyon]
MEGSTNPEHVIGIPVNSTAYGIEEPEFPAEEATPDHGGFVGSFAQSNNDSNSSRTAPDQTSEVRRTGGKKKIARGIKEHVTLGPKLSETVKGKLTLGARILQAGGVEKVFRQWFSVDKNERLIRASQCYLSTTAGPIAGLLFVSTERVAFRSDRPLAVTAPDGEKLRVPYKVTIPLRKVRRAVPTENKHKPEQRYIEVVTNDGFEFWFMGFVSYHRSLHHLEQAVAQAAR